MLLSSRYVKGARTKRVRRKVEITVLPYMFKRLAKMNRAGWTNYMIGAVAASSGYHL